MDSNKDKIITRQSKLSPAKQALLEKRLRGEVKSESRLKVIPRRSSTDPAPLSFAQQRLWFLQQLEPDNPFYNQHGALQLTGSLDVAALEQSLNEIVRRHEALRTTFKIVEGQPVQVIAPALNVMLPVVNLRELPEAEQKAEIQHLATEHKQRPFDLVQGPLLRWMLLQLDKQKYVLLVTMHHIIYDGWSLGVLRHELTVLYEAFCGGQPSPLPELPIQYADFAVWQRQWLQAEVLESQISYWKKHLRGAPTVLELPSDYPRPAVQAFRGATHSFGLSQELSVALNKLSQQEGSTLFMTLLAAFKTLLHRYTGSEDIVVGSPIANRNRAEIEGLIGYFVNTLILRTDLSDNPTFGELLGRVREVALGAYANQDLPFEQLVEELQPQRSLSHTPLFQVVFVLQNASRSKIELSGLTLSYPESDSGGAKFDLTLSMEETGEGLMGTVEYNTDLFKPTTITRMLGHFQTFLSGIVANPQQRLSELPLLTEPERHQLLVEWNDTSVEYPQQQCIHQLFEAQVELTPDAVAVVFEDSLLTYQELNARANQLAHYLRSLDVGPEALVGICVERSLHMVIGVLGILKAGGAYVPLDPAYPKERLAFILQDAQVPVLLTQQHLIEKLPESQTRVVCLDTDWRSIAKQSQQNLISDCATNNLAYVIYTSGSTGQPKGVLVNHSNVVHLLEATQSWYHFNQQDVFSLFHSIAFDFSVWELWSALLYGGQLVVVPYWLSRSPEDFYKLLSTQQVTVLNQTPSAFRQLIHAEESLGGANNLSLRLVIFGGEALELQSLKPWFERHGDQFPQLVNMYGITETTVHVTYRPLTRADLEAASGSIIGRPIPDLQVYLLDQYRQPVPIGVPGEMYVGGASVARGYLNRPELTAQRFIPNCFSDQPNARLYKSGDLARYLPNGDIEYLGRIDHQVKIRGFRIELGEIENALAKHQAVQEAVVLAREPQHGDKQLVTYVVPSNKQTPTISDLRNFLWEHLPEYMVPSAFVLLEVLPLTPNGKVDHRALPAPDTARPELAEVFVAPCTPEEKRLAEIWAKVLGHEQVGIHDNFFSLGGDSIRSIQVQSLAKEKGLRFSIQQMFQYQTIYQLLGALKTAESRIIKSEESHPFSLVSQEDKQRLPERVEDAYPLSMLQMGMVFHSESSPEKTTYHDVFSYHLQAPIEIQVLQAALQLLVNRHAVLRTSFQLADFSEPLQLVHQNIDVPLQVEDWHHLSTSELEDALNAWLEEEKRRHFDWSIPPLLRFFVHRCREETFYLTVSFHHTILDGWSVASMITELFGHYFSLLGEIADFLKPLPLSVFRDFVALERETIAFGESQRYWTEKLHNSTITMLPRWNFIPPKAKVQQVGEQEVPISAEIFEGLQQLAKSIGVPLKSILLAAHLRVLSLLCGQSDVLTGVVTNGRPEQKDGDRVLGLFLNTVPFPLKLSGGTWVDLVQEVFKVEREWLPHRRYPLAEIQRSLGGLPLFETLFNFTHFHVYQGVVKDKNVQLLGGKFYEETNFPLTAEFSQHPSYFVVKLLLKYNIFEFGLEQIKSISGYYARTLQAIVSNPQERYELRDLLSAQERHQLLIEWNNTQTNYPIDQCIHQLFEAQVERTPDAVAVVFEEQQLTYTELNARANQLAHYLKNLGVRPEVLVGICVERSLHMLIGLLGILKAGGAYVPLDPAYPQERLAFMLSDSQAPVLLTQQHLLERLPEHPAQVVCLDTDWHIISPESQQNPDSRVISSELAYVIYTSGSTGKPKGVQILHKGVVNFLKSMEDQPGLTKSDILVAVTSISFDIAALELYLPLITGARLVLVNRAVATDGQQLSEQLNCSSATIMQATPATWQMLLTAGWQNSACLKILCGGEALSRELAKQLLEKGATLWNLYGPTETTIWSTANQVEATQLCKPLVPIGCPIANTQIYLLDSEGQPTPIGVPGELYIGGDGLARGYLNRPDLTAEKFIPNPFSDKPGVQLYKTGDKARYLPNGQIEYIGRIDHQVKVRGFRIELGEIEALINQHPAVRETVVVVREDSADSQHLVAYVVLHLEQTLTITELRRFLESKLPNYMVPAAYVMLEALPLTPNGKVDRKALPVPDLVRPELEVVYQPPQTEVEQTIANIYQEVLQVKDVGIHDNFFELGGHSLLLLQVHSKLQKTFQRDFPLVEMFQYPTISHLARYLSQESSEQESLTQHSHRPESRVGSVQRRKQARKEHRAATKQKGVSSQ